VAAEAVQEAHEALVTMSSSLRHSRRRPVSRLSPSIQFSVDARNASALRLEELGRRNQGAFTGLQHVFTPGKQVRE
jgi:hypothetical protein